MRKVSRFQKVSKYIEKKCKFLIWMFMCNIYLFLLNTFTTSFMLAYFSSSGKYLKKYIYKTPPL